MEREISDLKNTQRVLGDSVAWIVDTLLQDPGDVSSPAEGEEHAKKLKERKREALESLAYVRDVLKGVVGTEEIDEERLVGEEEFRKRKAREKEREREERQREDSASSKLGPGPPAPLPSAEIRPVMPAAHTQTQSHSRNATSSSAHSPPKPTHAFPPHPPSTTASAFVQSRQSAASTLATSRRPSAPPHPAGTGATGRPGSISAFAPWNHSRSSFNASETPITGLPRIPPPTSTSLLRPPPAAASTLASAPRSQSSLSDKTVSGQSLHVPTPAPRRVEHDPLGAIP